MKTQEILEMSDDELISKQDELKGQLFKLKFQHALGQLDNFMKLKNIKKDIARIKTRINQKSEETESSNE